MYCGTLLPSALRLMRIIFYVSSCFVYRVQIYIACTVFEENILYL